MDSFRSILLVFVRANIGDDNGIVKLLADLALNGNPSDLLHMLMPRDSLYTIFQQEERET